MEQIIKEIISLRYPKIKNSIREATPHSIMKWQTLNPNRQVLAKEVQSYLRVTSIHK
jgi:hypothetical protein